MSEKAKGGALVGAVVGCVVAWFYNDINRSDCIYKNSKGLAYSDCYPPYVGMLGVIVVCTIVGLLVGMALRGR